MKKRILSIMAISISVIMTACGDYKASVKSNKEIVTETVDAEIKQESKSESFITDNSENISLTQEHTIDNISFSVDPNWTRYSEEQEGTFITKDKKSAYCLQGVSQIGSYTPDEFYKSILNGYQQEYEIISSDKEMSDFTTSDGIESKIARIEMKKDNVFFFIDLLIVPQKNAAITFAVQAADKDSIPIDIREITNTAKVNIANEDYISGNTFTCSDGSELCLEDNNEFIYYQSEDDHSKPYCTGKYEVFRGQEAIDKVDSLKDYGLTKDEQEQTLKANMNGYKLGGPSPIDYIEPENYYDSDNIYQICKDSYYAVILHNEKLVDSEKITDMGNDSLYIGYYIPEIDYADMINANTANYANWTLKK